MRYVFQKTSRCQIFSLWKNWTVKSKMVCDSDKGNSVRWRCNDYMEARISPLEEAGKNGIHRYLPTACVSLLRVSGCIVDSTAGVVLCSIFALEDFRVCASSVSQGLNNSSGSWWNPISQHHGLSLVVILVQVMMIQERSSQIFDSSFSACHLSTIALTWTSLKP